MNLINSRAAEREIILEIYRQTCTDTRAYMDLRFKHFGTFVVLTSLLGALAFNFNSLALCRGYISLFAVGLTLLFWLLDYRTSLFHKTTITQTYKCHEMMGSPFAQKPKLRKSISASLITNIIFGMILIFWVAISTYLFISPSSGLDVHNYPSNSEQLSESLKPILIPKQIQETKLALAPDSTLTPKSSPPNFDLLRKEFQTFEKTIKTSVNNDTNISSEQKRAQAVGRP